MHKLSFLFLMLVLSSGLSFNLTAQKSPNVIFIYADDLGYGDLSCYGADSIHTPHLDQMAAQGIRFTDFYATSPICSPSRISLLTGRYQVRAGITRVFFPNSLQGIDSTEYTMAEMFKSKGYTTGMVGKWHLGHLPPFLPRQHGFDDWFGLPYSNDMTWKPRKDPPLPLMRNEKIIAQPAHQPTLTQRYTTEAINFISLHRDQPFFLYMPHTFPHKPLFVSAEYENTSALGKYGDVVQELDRSVGKILMVLNQLGIAENTLVIFSSDNGPALKGGGKTGGLRGHKATTFEGGIRVPTLAYWPGTIKPGKVIKTPAIMNDWLPTFADLIGATLPDDLLLDGKDISALLLRNEEKAEARNFFFYFNETLRAVRSGNWKLKLAVNNNPYRQRLNAHEDLLFDLSIDPNETHNLAKEKPQIVQSLKELMNQFENNLGQVPAPKLKAVPFDDPRKKD